MRISDWSSDVCSSDLKQADSLALAAREQADTIGQPIFQPQAKGGQALAEFIAHGVPDGFAKTTALAPAVSQGQVFFYGQVFARSRHGIPEHSGHLHGTLSDRLPGDVLVIDGNGAANSQEEHTSELQSPMRISYADFCLKKKKHKI